jgi:hypothetical protein
MALTFERVMQDGRILAVGTQSFLGQQRGHRVEGLGLLSSERVVEVEAHPAALGEAVPIEEIDNGARQQHHPTGAILLPQQAADRFAPRDVQGPCAVRGGVGWNHLLKRILRVPIRRQRRIR